MRSRVETEIISQNPTVIVLARPSTLVASVEKALTALHLQAVLVGEIGQGGLTQIIRDTHAFALLWIDTPDGGQNPEKSAFDVLVLQELSQLSGISILYVGFDIQPHAKGKSNYWQLPILPSPIQKVVYQHVVSLKGSISLVESAILRSIQAGKVEEKNVSWSPILEQDCAVHIAELFLRLHNCEGVYEGTTETTYHDTVTQVAKATGHHVVMTPTANFPFSFYKAQKIPGRDEGQWMDVLAGKISKKEEVVSPDIVESVSQTQSQKILATHPRAEHIPQQVLRKPKHSHSRLQTVFMVVAGILGLFFIAYVGLAVFFLTLFQSLRSDLQVFVSQSGVSSSFSVEESKSTIDRLFFIQDTVPLPYELLGFSMGKDGIHTALQTLTTMIEGIEYQQKTYSKLSRAYGQVTQESAGEVENLESLTIGFDDSYRSFSQAQARLSQSGTALSALFGIEQKNIKQTFTGIREKMLAQRAATSILPTMLGTTGTTTYAVVLQDSNEIRSTGGGIQSLALITFDKGKLFSFETYQVQDLDELMKGVVTPPAEIQTYLNKQTWLLEDANWSPETTISARQVAWFLSKQIQKDVDGVIFLPSSVLPQLLAVTGNLSLPTGVTLTQSSITDTVRMWSASTQGQKEEWKLTLQALIGNLTALPESKRGELGKFLVTQFDAGNISLFHKNVEVGKTLTLLGWDGAIRTPQCPASFGTDTCVVSTVYQVENNIGDNPVGLFIEREVSHVVSFSTKAISHTHTITFQNNATKDEWPEGGYRTLLKLIVENGATLEKITLNNTIIENGRTTSEFGKTVFAVPLEVPRSQTVAVTLQYSTPAITKEGSAFILFHQKQMGIADIPLKVEFNYGDDFTPKTIAPAGTILPLQTKFENVLDTNRLFGVGF